MLTRAKEATVSWMNSRCTRILINAAARTLPRLVLSARENEVTSLEIVSANGTKLACKAAAQPMTADMLKMACVGMQMEASIQGCEIKCYNGETKRAVAALGLRAQMFHWLRLPCVFPGVLPAY